MKAQIKKLWKTWKVKFGIIFLILITSWKLIDDFGNWQTISQYLPYVGNLIKSPLGIVVLFLFGFGIIFWELQRQNRFYKFEEQQRENINNFIFIKSITCKIDDEPIPIARFFIDVFNASVFEIFIDSAMSGHIELDRTALRGQLKYSAYPPPKSIKAISDGRIIIEQELVESDLKLIKDNENTLPAGFEIYRLIICIKLIEDLQIESKRLKFPEGLKVSRFIG